MSFTLGRKKLVLRSFYVALDLILFFSARESQMLPFHLVTFSVLFCSFFLKCTNKYSHPHLNEFRNTVHPKAQMTYCTWPWMHTHTHMHIYTKTQDRAISQHPQSIRPQLIPLRSLVQCSCIYRSQASTLLFLQHSVLITFLCFLSP